MRLVKPVFLLLLLSLSGTLRAEEPAEKKRFIGRVFDKLTASKGDSAYVVRYPYRFCIKPKLSTSFSWFNFKWVEEDTKKHFGLLSRPIWKAGVNFTYRNITVGLQRNVSRWFGSGDGEDFEVAFSAYGSTLGCDFFYNTSDHYKLIDRNTKGWKQEVACFDIQRLQANVYYLFNNKKFSYSAAFTQSYLQKRSCGSFLVGLSLNYERLLLDFNGLSEEAQAQVGADEYAHTITYRSFGVNGGYAYNWVLGRHWLIHGSAIPSLSIFRRGRMHFNDRTEKLNINRVNFGCIVRVGILWTVSRYFAGFTTVMTVNSLSRKPIDMNDCYVRSRIFYGFRF